MEFPVQQQPIITVTLDHCGEIALSGQCLQQLALRLFSQWIDRDNLSQPLNGPR